MQNVGVSTAQCSEQVAALSGPLLQVLRAHPEGVGVHELVMLLRQHGAYAELEHSPLGLFRLNFILMHALFRLQREVAQWSQWLQVTTLCVRLLPREDTPVQALDAAANGALRDYYLDWQNLADTGADDVEALLQGFWRSYLEPAQLQQARDVLGVAAGDSLQQVRRAYQQQAQQHHPDRGGDAAKFIDVRGAWEVLRASYALAR